MGRLHSNNFETRLTADITSGATTVPVASVTGLPSLTSDTFNLTISNGTTEEIVQVTAIATLDLTVVRAQEGTTGTAFVSGDYVSLRFTADSVDRKLDTASDVATNIGEPEQAFGNVTTAATTSTIDCDVGTFATIQIGVAHTIAFSNPHASGTMTKLQMLITNGSAFAITWPGSVSWDGAAAPVWQTSGSDIAEFITVDGGTTWRGRRIWASA